MRAGVITVKIAESQDRQATDERSRWIVILIGEISRKNLGEFKTQREAAEAAFDVANQYRVAICTQYQRKAGS